MDTVVTPPDELDQEIHIRGKQRDHARTTGKDTVTSQPPAG
jgi:hypothetical protein